MTDANHVHLYTLAAEPTKNVYYTAHIAFTRTREIVRLGRKSYQHLTGLKEATQTALRDGLADVFDACNPDSVTVHENVLPTPELELGRLPHDARRAAGDARISFTRYLQNNCEKLVSALATQNMGSLWHTGSIGAGRPRELTVYVDGSHWPGSHPDLSAEEDGSTTIGYIIVDAVGRVIEMEATELDDATESLHAEYVALKQAMESVKQINPSAEVLFKTDNEQLVRTFERHPRETTPRFRPLAGYLKEMLATFEDATVRHVSRDQNPFTDALADVAHDREITYNPVDVETATDDATHAYTV